MEAVAYIGDWFQCENAEKVIEKNREKHVGEMEAYITAGSFRADGTPSSMSVCEETERALAAGADIVLRLPTIAVLSGRDVQAFATLTAADRLSVVRRLAVPVSGLTADLLEQIAMFLFKEPMPYQKEVRKLMAEGMKFSEARAKGVEVFVPGAENVLMNNLNSYAVELRLAALRRYSRVKLELVETGQPMQQDLSTAEECSEAAQTNLQDQRLAEMIHDYLRDRSDKELLSIAQMTPSFPWSVSERLIALKKEILEADSFQRMAELLEGGKVSQDQVRRGLLMLILGIRLPNLSIAGLEAFGPYIRVQGLAGGIADIRAGQEHLDRQENLDRQECLDRQEHLDRQENLDRQECLDRQEHLDRQENLDRQEYLDRQENLDRQEHLDRLARLDRQKYLDRQECWDTENMDRKLDWEEVLRKAGTHIIGTDGETLFGSPMDESRARLAKFDLDADQLWQKISV